MPRDYTKLITSQHADKPRFVATVALTTGMLGQAASAAQATAAAFDVDTAVGAQLDAVGLWVGISRALRAPIANAYFSFNTAGLGWNQANWKGPFDPVAGIVELDDETYRGVIKAKILSNYWDGTNAGLLAIGQALATSIGLACFFVDNMDMSVTVYIVGTPTAVQQALIRQGVIFPKAAGVRITGYNVAAGPFFALDAPTGPLLAGLDYGYLGSAV